VNENPIAGLETQSAPRTGRTAHRVAQACIRQGRISALQRGTPVVSDRQQSLGGVHRHFLRLGVSQWKWCTSRLAFLLQPPGQGLIWINWQSDCLGEDDHGLFRHLIDAGLNA
jgi:hypothetical protein